MSSWSIYVDIIEKDNICSFGGLYSKEGNPWGEGQNNDLKLTCEEVKKLAGFFLDKTPAYSSGFSAAGGYRFTFVGEDENILKFKGKEPHKEACLIVGHLKTALVIGFNNGNNQKKLQELIPSVNHVLNYLGQNGY